MRHSKAMRQTLIYLGLAIMLSKSAIAMAPLHKPSTQDAMEWAANQEGLPVALVKGLCFVESSHKPSAIHFKDHGANSVGLCQIKLTTARMQGYTGTEKGLLNPYTNALYASKLLNKQLKRYGKLEYAIAAYNRGTLKLVGKGKRRAPSNNAYVSKVTRAMLRFI